MRNLVGILALMCAISLATSAMANKEGDPGRQEPVGDDRPPGEPTPRDHPNPGEPTPRDPPSRPPDRTPEPSPPTPRGEKGEVAADRRQACESITIDWLRRVRGCPELPLTPAAPSAAPPPAIVLGPPDEVPRMLEAAAAAWVAACSEFQSAEEALTHDNKVDRKKEPCIAAIPPNLSSDERAALRKRFERETERYIEARRRVALVEKRAGMSKYPVAEAASGTAVPRSEQRITPRRCSSEWRGTWNAC